MPKRRKCTREDVEAGNPQEKKKTDRQMVRQTDRHTGRQTRGDVAV